jgi:excisionase family DNA binding protein
VEIAEVEQCGLGMRRAVGEGRRRILMARSAPPGAGLGSDPQRSTGDALRAPIMNRYALTLRQVRAVRGNQDSSGSRRIARIMDGDEVLTPAEAAEMLAIKESTLRDYARRGLVPSIRVGRHLRFLKSDIRGYLESLRGRR